MTPSTTQTDELNIGAREVEHEHHGRMLAALTVGLALVTATTIVSWDRIQHTRPHHATTQFGPGSPEIPGGSVYNEQVPQAPAAANLDQPGNPLATSGSVYKEQVPQAPAAANLDQPGNPLATRGSVYKEQVPQSTH
jgi:hypothetical protein